MGIEQEILKTCHTIAVVGLSNSPERNSFRVARYLKSVGYRIIAVNPTIREWLGDICYPDLQAVPDAIDVVDIFRRAEEVPAIVEQAIKKGVVAVWMQEGIINEQAAARAKQAGIKVVMDRCMLKEHSRMVPDNIFFRPGGTG